jgi:hypothetical protein
MGTDRKIVAGDIWPVFNFGDPNERYRKFLNTKREALKRFLESLITHDQVIIPTDDYMSLSIALSVLGETQLLRLIDEQAVAFVRIKGAIAYVGNGGGLSSVSIASEGDRKRAFCAPMDEAIRWALDGIQNVKETTKITNSVINATTELAVSVISGEISQEVSKDVGGSETLRLGLGLGDKDIRRLPGIKPAEVRIYGGEFPNRASNAIEAVLGIAHANLELKAAEEVGADDLSTACPIGHVLKSKEERLSNSTRKWLDLVEIADLPDVGELLLNDRSHLDKFLKLRRSSNAAEFRKWFSSNSGDDPKKTAKEYVKLLRGESLVDGQLARCIRFVGTTAIGLKFGDTSGTVAGALDSFVVDRLLRRPSAKIFIEKLRQFEPAS